MSTHLIELKEANGVYRPHSSHRRSRRQSSSHKAKASHLPVTPLFGPLTSCSLTPKTTLCEPLAASYGSSREQRVLSMLSDYMCVIAQRPVGHLSYVSRACVDVEAI